ncbi:DNA-binding protein [Candidatus Williamhamiltonella defendens]|uniref:helix-turn-helix domain-containing transcriptional regulator n=1 Tax=Candidatus Williamhamiltonella defendens TaxID=138072 RepID=UPI0002ED84D2|nr:hypothetical protein [Candidatus Hamiltonella defensa]
MKDRTHDAAMAEVFRDEPSYAVELLNHILVEGSQAELLIALRQMTEAFGGVRRVAKSARLNPNQLYRTLSDNGNPEMKSLIAILSVMGLRLTIEPIKSQSVHDIPHQSASFE